MASHNRQERQLMRQRGASSRNVPSANFGLGFDIGFQRQERQQMRQRGAGTRKADAVDFGLSFQTPARSRRSTSRTPALREPVSTRSSRSSVRRNRESSGPALQRSVSVPLTVDKDTRHVPSHQQPLEEPDLKITKRRKTDTNEYVLNKTPNVGTPRILANSSRRTSRIPVFTIAESPEEASTEVIRNSPAQLLLYSPLFVPQDEIDKENNSPENTQKISGKKKARSGISMEQQNLIPLLITPRAMPHEATEAQSSEGTLIDQAPPARAEVEDASAEVPVNDEDHESQALKSTQEPKKRKKRKSVVLGRKKRRSSGQTIDSVERGSIEPREETDIPVKRQYSTSPALVSQRRPVRLSRQQPLAADESHMGEKDDEGDEDYIDEEHSPEPPTPAPLRKSRTTKDGGIIRSRIRSAQPRLSKPTQNKQSSFPILTYRMTNFNELPTISEESEEAEGEAEEVNLNTYVSSRSVPNAVDVLAQICRESIATTMERLTAGSESRSSKAELKRKRSALEAFATDLDGRLFDMSAAVENRIVLESRVRKQKRETAELQARWIEVRRQREQVALKCDQIRREHWQDEHNSEERWRISESAQKVELELERGAAEEVDDIGYLLQTISRRVSNKQHDAGILDKIRIFNFQLESLASVLESGLV